MQFDKKPASFLSGIRRIIFDMDGVMTSEQNYWNAAALTIYEMFYSRQYYGEKEITGDLTQEEIFHIRKRIFLEDKMISLLKNRGMNSNWDLTYAVVCVVLILKKTEPSFNMDEDTVWQKVYDYFLEHHMEGYELLDFIVKLLIRLYHKDWQYFGRNGELWNICKDIFQEWVLGDEIYYKHYKIKPNLPGKKGLMYSEQPIIPLEELKEVLKTLYSAGITLGIGTGRPFVEIDQPLISWDIKKYFSEEAYITYNEVMEAEERYLATKNQHIHLAKPHPYMFLKGIYGKDFSDEKLLKKQYDTSKIEETLIVGDAGSDIMAAKAINCKFAAVLTGVAGERGRDYFKKMKADYILKDVRELIS